MAARPGEENVATLFSDIHYFYDNPSAKPRHHRFDKGSYVYLFENAAAHRARLEIANHAGTEDQDAFDGYLDMTFVTYSYRHSCMVSLTVGATPGNEEWHLPTYDPHNESKYHYKLHSLDIYFWTQNDALLFLNSLRRILPASQVDVQDEPGTSSVAMSPIVQQLEKTVISDPVYTTPASLPGPPPGGPPGSNTVSPVSTSPGGVAAPAFVPMAYNPAAPAAPEVHQTREKTPPPEEDDNTANPLAAVMAVDYQQSPFTPGFRLPPNHPAANGMASPAFAPVGMSNFAPPPTVGISRASTTPASPYISIPPPPASTMLPPPPPPQTQPLVQSPSLSTIGTLPQNLFSLKEHRANPLYIPEVPTPAPLASPPPSADYSIHHQVYQPQVQKIPGVPHAPQLLHPQKKAPSQRSNLEEKTARLEKGVTGMLRKFEKKFG